MKKIILITMMLFFLHIVSSLEDCKGAVTEDEVPCLLLLASTDCTPIVVSVYNNASTLLYTTDMIEYNSFTCNATFNQTPLGTYTFNYTTGDSGSIIVEEGTMNFFNLLIYIVFMAITLVLIVFMHKFKEDAGSAIVYGGVATTISIIMGAIILSPAYDVIRGITLLIDVNFYLAGLCFAIGLYTLTVSVFLYRDTRPKEEHLY